MTFLFKEKLLAKVGLIVLLSAFYWLYKTEKLSHTVAIDLEGYINLPKNPDRNFYVRQNGEYYVLYNYIKAKKEFTANESVTLVLSGEWRDLGNLAESVQRWHGPVSLTIFSCGEDFDHAINLLIYISQCTDSGEDFKTFVTVNFIMHRNYLPFFIPGSQLQTYFLNANCFDVVDFKEPVKQYNVTFPINLARNVGRATAGTHFILMLDPEALPSIRIPELFLKMIKAKEDDIHQPKTTVYVLPSFDTKIDSYAPTSDLELNELDKKFLLRYFKSESLHKVPRFNEWVVTKDKKLTDIFHETRRWGDWIPYYIGANNIVPFYDETYDSESKIDYFTHMDLLEALEYNFYIVNLGFIVRRLLPPYKFVTEVPMKKDPKTRVKKLLRIKDLQKLYSNFK